MFSFKTERAFRTIVASGKNSSFPHHVSEDVKITFPIVIDFGVNVNGYCSDVTRTIESPYEKKLEKILQELYSFIKPEIKAMDAEKFVRDKLNKESKYFIHSLGHGIGLEVHENPTLSIKSNDILEKNMIFTIEPGLYKKTGIRIENDFLLNDRLKNLTNF